MEMEKKVKLLTDTKKNFDENKIDFLCLYCTLLGFLRNKGIIPWDPDIDFGVWYKDYNNIIKLRSKFEKLGYKLIISSSHIDICYKEDFEDIKNNVRSYHKYDEDPQACIYNIPFHIGIDFIIKDGKNVIMFKFFDENIFNKLFGRLGKLLNDHYERKENKLFLNLVIKKYNLASRFFNSIFLFVRRHKIFPAEWFEKPSTMEIYNLEFKIPMDYEKYLEEVYGKNWRIPIGTNKSYPKALKKRKSKAMRKYRVKDKKIRELWLKRGEIGSTYWVKNR